jgi:hypothetical protein
MKVTVSLDFDALKEEIRDAFVNRLEDFNYSNDDIENLANSFMDNIDGGYMDATFEVEMNDDETEVTACMLVGG